MNYSSHGHDWWLENRSSCGSGRRGRLNLQRGSLGYPYFLDIIQVEHYLEKSRTPGLRRKHDLWLCEVVLDGQSVEESKIATDSRDQY